MKRVDVVDEKIQAVAGGPAGQGPPLTGRSAAAADSRRRCWPPSLPLPLADFDVLYRPRGTVLPADDFKSHCLKPVEGCGCVGVAEIGVELGLHTGML